MSLTETKTIEVDVEALERASKEAKAAAAKKARGLRLTPTVNPTVARFLEQKETLFSLVSALGSPLNILFPDLIEKNVEGFTGTFKKLSLLGKVFFAHKCNQSDSLVRRLALTDANLDVSSAGELRHALGSGFDSSRIEATGPKNTEFIGLAVQQGVTIAVDSISELKKIVALRPKLKLKKPTKVLLRLSGFEASHSKFLNKGSRFGIPIKEAGEAFDILEANRKEINLLGFSFHLDTVSVLERAIAIENCLELFEEALSRDFEPRVLDIGGGYKVNYLQNEDEWNAYVSALKEAVLGTRPPMTWHGNAFGMSSDKGKLKGNFNSYSYFDTQTGGDFLDELLSQKFANLGDATAASILRDNMIELWIEPGRSLVEQCGITVGRVNSVRTSSRGEPIVCLNMKRQDISFLDQEVFVDPIIVSCKDSEKDSKAKKQAASAPPAEAIGVFFAGNLCLESDLIYRHLTYLDKLPEEGDLVVFVNTAGYFMDFSATTSIMHPIAQKVAVSEKDGKFTWTMDDQYVPF
ncbi:MAG: Y4yA family PLP-dependent enzyme [Cyanobacteria bacterium SZAS LIN-3]|nr:Y4yA family PLP-dependent enzyme [Cyanobacteria bacterium SZAS LIN-3]